MPRTRRPRRGIYLLPTLFTVGNLFCGFASLLQVIEGHLDRAALLIIVAGVLDALDGRIARMTRATSDFGVQFDSLADLLSFGVAPAILAHAWALSTFERLGSWIAFLFVVCAAMRLARFNAGTAGGESRRYFVGLPSPPAAGMLAAFAFAFPAPGPPPSIAVARALLVVTLALLMVSRFRYRTFKDLDLSNRRSYVYVLPLAAAVVAVLIYPQSALPVIATAYVVSGPASLVWTIVRRRRLRRAGAEIVDEPVAR